MPIRRRVDQRTHRLAVKGQLAGLAFMAGKEPDPYGAHIPEKRGPNKPSGNVLERDVVHDIQELSQQSADLQLYRNVSGHVELDGGGRIKYGVGPSGASDFIGWHSVVVTQAMVGSTVAIFCAVEAKSPTGMPTDDQMKFIFRVRKAGGRAGIARSSRDARDIVT